MLDAGKLVACDGFFPWENYADARCFCDRNLITAKGYAFVDFTLAVCDNLNIYQDKNQRYEQLERIKEQAPPDIL